MLGRVGPVIDCVVFDLDGTLTVPGGGRAVPGVAAALAALAAAGVELAVATSAPTPRARRVLADLDLDRWFTSVAGAASNASGALMPQTLTWTFMRSPPRRPPPPPPGRVRP